MPTTMKKILLKEEDIPKQWYNIVPDLPKPLPPFIDPATKQPGVGIVPRIFPKEIIGQEISQERWIDIPDEVREVYRIWRPSPLFRATRLRKSAENTSKNLLQVRRRKPSWKPQTQHRRAPSILQHERRHQTPLN